jgi:phospholipase/lecithinase/hemolysin
MDESLQKLIAMGATDIVVPGVLPIGCFPIYLTIYGTSDAADYDGLGCLKKFNDLSTYHNNQLQAQIRSLQAKYSSARIIYADFYSGVYDMVKSPASYGTYTRRRTGPLSLGARSSLKKVNNWRLILRKRCGAAGLI